MPPTPPTAAIPRRTIARAALRVLLTCAALAFLVPLAWMLLTSVQTAEQASAGALALPPDPAAQAASNYARVWTDDAINFPLYLRNTLIVALLSVGGMTLSSAVVAYGLARIRFRGRAVVFALILATMMIPFPVIMAPLYLVFRDLGWVGTLKPLWVPAWFGSAFNIFLLRQFYMGIPRELDEAARIDGMGHLGIFTRVILPLSRPALAVVALFHFIYVWNDFLGPLIFLTSQDDYTLALGLQQFQAQAGLTPWNLLMAASAMVVAPVLVLFLLTQKTFVQGLATEGLKE